LKRLEAHGNAFLRMFDDYKEQPGPTRQRDIPAKAVPGNGEPRRDGGEGAIHPEDPSKAQTAAGAEMSEIFEHLRRRPWAQKPRTVTFSEQTPRAGAAAEAARAALERRAFMSSKASKVHGPAAPAAPPRASALDQDEERGFVTREDFEKMRREAEELGASALDKGSKKAMEARMLARLGAKPEKGHRIPASIGKIMAKNRAERSKKALEEAINCGMIQRKGLGKKRRAAERAKSARPSEDFGVKLKNGILHAKPPARKSTPKKKGSILKGIKM